VKGRSFYPFLILLMFSFLAACSLTVPYQTSIAPGKTPTKIFPTTSPISPARSAPTNPKECTIGDAMGNATTDGRPISWKDRDEDSGPVHFINYVIISGGKYGILGMGYDYPFDIKMGVNEAGLSLQNSLCENMTGSESYRDFKLYALSQTGSIAELRQAIIEDTNGTVNHWNSEPAICAGFSDAHGYATLFELQQWKYHSL